MVKNADVLSLYGQVQNLRPFTHPAYNQRFRFMTIHETVSLAEKILANIRRSSLSNVLVSESGASPIAWVCRLLDKRNQSPVSWHSFKVPRDPAANPYPILMSYLTDEERLSRGEQLKKACRNVQASALAVDLPRLLRDIAGEPTSTTSTIPTILRGTRIASVFSRPFLFFDEYIDSGTTLANAVRYAHYFARSPNMRIGCYYLNVEDPQSYPAVSFALHTRRDQLSCFRRGIYPFENRIDLIGYWYTSTAGTFDRTEVTSLISETESDCTGFMQTLAEKASTGTIYKEIREGMKIRPVQDYLSTNHIIQYLLYRLEAATGVSPRTTAFLFQLFEMYAPIWSPLPDAYHLDFVAAFDAIDVTSLVDSLLKEYTFRRASVLSAAARACEARRNRWRSLITHSLSIL